MLYIWGFLAHRNSSRCSIKWLAIFSWKVILHGMGRLLRGRADVPNTQQFGDCGFRSCHLERSPDLFTKNDSSFYFSLVNIKRKISLLKTRVKFSLNLFSSKNNRLRFLVLEWKKNNVSGFKAQMFVTETKRQNILRLFFTPVSFRSCWHVSASSPWSNLKQNHDKWLARMTAGWKIDLGHESNIESGRNYNLFVLSFNWNNLFDILWPP